METSGFHLFLFLGQKLLHQVKIKIKKISELYCTHFKSFFFLNTMGSRILHKQAFGVILVIIHLFWHNWWSSIKFVVLAWN